MATCLHTTWTVHPGTEDELLIKLVPVRQFATGQRKCQYFNAFKSADQPGVVRVVEIWDSQADYLASLNRNQAVIADFYSVADGMSIQPRVTEAWNPVDGFKHVRRG